VFDGFVQPHSCIPYFHMGFIMHLYSRIFFLWITLIYGPKARTFLVVLSNQVMKEAYDTTAAHTKDNFHVMVI
jgi:hypothetical protein